MKTYTRLCLYPKDVMLIMGRGPKYAYRYLAKIKRHYEKQPEQFVTVAEFCAYSGLPEEAVRELLK